MKFEVKTKGHVDIIDITGEVENAVATSGVAQGICLVSVACSTAAVTTMEYEEGLISDLRSVLGKIAPEDFDWLHHKRWGDHNGSAHILSAIIGASVALPVRDRMPVLGEWQRVVLIDPDERPRTRVVEVTVVKS